MSEKQYLFTGKILLRVQPNCNLFYRSLEEMWDTDTLLLFYPWLLKVNRGVASPPDISMDISKIVAELGVSLTDFATGVALTFSSKGK